MHAKLGWLAEAPYAYEQYRLVANYKDPKFLLGRIVDKLLCCVVLIILYVGDSLPCLRNPSIFMSPAETICRPRCDDLKGCCLLFSKNGSGHAH